MGAWEDGFAAGYREGISHTHTSVGVARRAAKGSTSTRRSTTKKRAAPRKLTAHNRFMKKEMKSLKKKHPRMKQPAIMKKANVAWRKHKRSRR
jgi:hypothetical protein